MNSSSNQEGRVFLFLKQSSELIKHYGLIILVLIIVFKPEMVKSWFKDSGFKKFSGFGVELTLEEAKKIEQTGQDFNDFQQLIEKLEYQVRKSKQTLIDLKTVITDPKQRKELTQQIKSSKNVLADTEVGAEQLKKTAIQLAPIIVKMQHSALIPDSSWGVVFGGDTRLEAAKHEIQRTKNRGFEDTIIFLRKNYYRSVITFSTKEDAMKRLYEVKSKIRESSYLVNLKSWCGTQIPHSEYVLCK